MVSHHAAPTAREPVPGARVLIVEARFYADIADELLRGARAAIEAAQGTADVLTVDGALEIPATVAIALDAAAAGKTYDAVVALGCVIRAETGHYDIVAGESARALMDLSVAAKDPARQRDPDRRKRVAGLDPARVNELKQGRRGRGGALAVLRIKRRVEGQTR
jgi:6,7-dimethyl-8-ribityllumazine synthase